ncbi:acyl-CoA dehydrogenase family protein [Shewanella sedimentimangrovi]|uniref:Acyl-CoA/acyl-ACP dehydrogenase n=1 Tax=Shewanella sedimentimangrovi TaxID=2814293 RepID=A0ABX7QZS3_9GAMM|nr:acyl-CoA dehydrogenase family protein [Shewanella sedimentimangrovi]QSX36110.1 acyl-CoA/acyl-ACP dehydrogenase [Shewanella sedimentimangrovi]
MHELISPALRELQTVAQAVTDEVIAPNAARVDEEARWPRESMAALADANLMGLHVPTRLGGHGQGLLALALLSETIARGCSSSALCFGMHCVGSAVIASKATAFHEQQYLVPIAENKHLTTLALSESGTGSHFYLPQTRLSRDGDYFEVNGTKQFVTNGGHADSYVISTQVSGQATDAGDFSCLIVDRDRPGMSWLDAWHGLGMRGNSSRGLQLEQLRVPVANLLGEEGDQIWYVFEVVAPFFLTAMAGTYLGLAEAALQDAVTHLRRRVYQHSGQSLADVSLLQVRLAEMKLRVEKCRALLYQAAFRGDQGRADTALHLMMAKADAADTATWVTNEAMSLGGGQAYRENGPQGRRLRDARAGHVMSPTTDLLKTWIGRQLLDLPLL